VTVQSYERLSSLADCWSGAGQSALKSLCGALVSIIIDTCCSIGTADVGHLSACEAVQVTVMRRNHALGVAKRYEARSVNPAKVSCIRALDLAGLDPFSDVT
jgi:hypothetical protein